MAGNELTETVTKFGPLMPYGGVRRQMTIMENVYRLVERAFISLPSIRLLSWA